jgi:VWFA-related protein
MKSSLSRTLLAASLLGLVAARPTAQQAPPPDEPQPGVTFRLEVNYVEVDAAVYDRQGRFVSDLHRSDFQVLEDGVPQEINAFSLVNIPIERAERPLYASHPIQPDIATNARPFDGRVYVLALDDLQTSSFRTPQVRAAARQFVETRMAANDIAAIVHIGGSTDAGQEFTSNKRLLLASIDRFMGRKIRSTTLERLDEYQRLRSTPSGEPISRVGDPRDLERGYNARSSLESLASLSEWVGSIRGRRKAIIYLSEGIDYNIYDFQNREATTIQDAMRKAIATATRSNVSIYAIDPRGLTTMGEESIEAAGGFPDDPLLNLSNQSFQDELRLAQQSLRSLAEDTGGYAAVNSNDFTKAWDRVVADNSSYYVLGYYPKNDKRDGRFRKIQVKVNRPGVDVRSRNGYTAPRGKPPAPTHQPETDKTSPELRQALDSPVPISGVTLRAFAAPFKGAAPNASIAVGVEAQGNDLAFTQKDGKFVNDLELSVIAIDTTGKIKGGDRNVINMGLKPETRERVSQTGIRMNTRLNLPPGRYQMRVAARESGAGHIGSVNYDLEGPDFSKEPLTMSGIVIASASGAQVMTAKPDEELRTVLPAPATAMRQFSQNDALAIFAEIYDNEPQTAHQVDITTTVLTDEGTTAFTTREERSSSELQGKKGGYGHTTQIPLKDLSPGLYVLKVEAKSRLGNQPSVSREVPFRIQ